MKTLRKIAFFTIIICVLFSLSSCVIPVKQRYNISDSIENIRSIDIYQAGNTEDDYILDIRGEAAPLYTLPCDSIQKFVDELESQKYKWTIWFIGAIDYIYEFSAGYTVVIEYQNGGCDIFAEHGIMLRGNYRPGDYYGNTPWNEFIEKYIVEN